jgi:hypothetical protein
MRPGTCPIKQLAADDAHLHLWTTNAFLLLGERPHIRAAFALQVNSTSRRITSLKLSPGPRIAARRSTTLGASQIKLALLVDLAFIANRPERHGRDDRFKGGLADGDPDHMAAKYRARDFACTRPQASPLAALAPRRLHCAAGAEKASGRPAVGIAPALPGFAVGSLSRA